MRKRTPIRTGLGEYRRKRRFQATPEPSGKKKTTETGRLYVIQKHAARRLHYDFRLELNGVLKSWAVPKGPSLNPADKRLAVEVEDHPIDYASFEGVIPQGQYGGGTVIVWDKGTWEPEEDPVEGWEKGSLKIRLNGEKLTGSWALVRMAGRSEGGKNNWLLIKHRDEAARAGKEADVVDLFPQSALSGRTIEEVAQQPGSVWESNRAQAAGAIAPASAKSSRRKGTARERAEEPRKSKARKTSTPRRDLPDIAEIPGARRQELPDWVEPQLATLVEGAPDGDQWIHEIKYDGYRLLCRKSGRDASYLTRKGLDWSARFGQLAAAAKALPVSAALIDGEVVFVKPDGTTDFQALQNSLSEGRGDELVFYAFDLLHLNGYDLRDVPLSERKRVLAAVLGPDGGQGRIRYSDYVAGKGPEFLKQACRYGLEGVISKLADRPYRSGRSRDWLKSKCLKSQEFIIGGYSEPEGSRSGFGALLLGAHEPGGGITYVGKVGTGFTSKSLADLAPRLRALEQKTPPFVNPPSGAAVRRVHWIKPRLVAQVSFIDRTREGFLRHPSFQGLREDKDPAGVKIEAPLEAQVPPPAKASKTEKKARGSKKSVSSAAGGPASGDAELVVAGVRITHPDRVIYPAEGTTKRDLAMYYQSVADLFLAQAGGRPLMLLRCPSGQGKPCFFQKHDGMHPAIRTIKLPEKGGGGAGMDIEDLAGLMALVQLNALEIHVWGSRSDRPDRPDRMIFDLDPGPAVEWKSVVEAALEVRAHLQDLGLTSFLKTTGGKGLHVVVPLERRQGWDEVKNFSRAFAEAMAGNDPRRYTANISKRGREDKIFIDYLRNSQGATAIAPYSARARAGATVSTPLPWEELNARLRPDRFTVRSFPALLSKRGDPWADMAKVRQTIPAIKG